ncbi:MAG: hypothetical protein WCW13_06885 [archaeon]|jgi:hypothetical protein
MNKKNIEGFNFWIGSSEYENKLSEILMPKSVFEKVIQKSKELNLPLISRIGYYSGATYQKEELPELAQELSILKNKFKEKMIQKYLEDLINLSTLGLKEKIKLNVIGQ